MSETKELELIGMPHPRVERGPPAESFRSEQVMQVCAVRYRPLNTRYISRALLKRNESQKTKEEYLTPEPNMRKLFPS
jgi:hypothetical protein